MSERKIDTANRRDQTKTAEAQAPAALRRRDFLIGGAAALGSGALAGPGFAASGAQSQTAQPQAGELGEPGIRKYRALGKTGLKVSDIGMGTGSMKQGVRYRYTIPHALDRGITYFDTAESYTQGGAERELGIALQGKRDKVVLVSKTIALADQRALSLGAQRVAIHQFDLHHGNCTVEIIHDSP